MTMLKHAAKIVAAAEAQAQQGASLEDVLAGLRGLAMEEFGELMFSLPHPRYPAISEMLPAMSSVETQKRWTGGSGLELLALTAAFVRQMQASYSDLRGESLRGKTILDFGVGYGRIMRLMYYFSDPDRLWGVDAWDRSLAESRQAGMLGHFAQSEDIPSALPVGDTRFDVGYAFSVFTHLSPKAAEAALDAIRAAMNPGGVFFATVRPVEFWEYIDTVQGTDNAVELVRQHEVDGFAFIPRDGPEGVSYGDSSVDLGFFDRPGWKVVGYNWSRIDSFQVAVVLEAV